MYEYYFIDEPACSVLTRTLCSVFFEFPIACKFAWMDPQFRLPNHDFLNIKLRSQCLCYGVDIPYAIFLLPEKVALVQAVFGDQYSIELTHVKVHWHHQRPGTAYP